jgi:hypothetical protein
MHLGSMIVSGCSKLRALKLRPVLAFASNPSPNNLGDAPVTMPLQVADLGQPEQELLKTPESARIVIQAPSKNPVGC